MATKSTTVKLIEQEQKYQRKVKSVELAIKATVGRNGAVVSTIMKAAKDIYEYINE